MCAVSYAMHMPLRLALICLLSTAATAAELHVRITDSDPASLQHAVDRAKPGDTIIIHPGIFRSPLWITCAANVEAPLTLTGTEEGESVLCGSRVVDGWSLLHGAMWSAPWTVDSQDVFCDGIGLRRVGPLPRHFSADAGDGKPLLAEFGHGAADLVEGSYCVEGGKITLWLPHGADPREHLIEASCERRILGMSDSASHVVIRRLTFRHSNASLHQAGGAAVELGSNCALEDCTVEACDFAGVALGYKRHDSRVVRCVLRANGSVGIGADAHDRFLISACEISDNNRRGFNDTWHAGGIKATSGSHGEVSGCFVHDNAGAGIWFDWMHSGNPSRIVGNRVVRNRSRVGGISCEGCDDTTVADNVLIANSLRGVYVSASDDIVVERNTITTTEGRAAIEVGGMPRAGRSLTNVTIRGNIIAGNRCAHDLCIMKENGGDIRGIASDGNIFHRSSASSWWWGEGAAGGWRGASFAQLAQWQRETPFDQHSEWRDPELEIAADGARPRNAAVSARYGARAVPP
jgi:parallel beta-helix repeat protein